MGKQAESYRTPSFFGDVTTVCIHRASYREAIRLAEQWETEHIQAFLRGYESARQERMEKIPKICRGISKMLYSFSEWVDPDPVLWGFREVLRVRAQK